MQASELYDILKRGEDSTTHQFKSNVTSPNAVAAEMVAFSNTQGGMLILGVDDTGNVLGIDPDEVTRLNMLISNSAANHVKNPINPITENLMIDGKLVMLIHVKEGLDKPYMDNQGIIWVKSGADKRKVTSKEELRRLFQSSGLIYADEMLIQGAGMQAINKEKFARYFEKAYNMTVEETGVQFDTLFENLHLARGGILNMAGLLLFAKTPSRWKPMCMIKAVSFWGNSIGGTEYRDSEDIEGTLDEQFANGMGFLLRNLKKTQQGQDFNSLGILEVSKIALQELLQNALIHRDYFKSAPIRALIFDNRIEIINPGTLPNSLTIENIRYGNSAIRNPIIASFAAKMLPYRGLGSGIIRALREQPNISFEEDRAGEQFKVIIPRPEEMNRSFSAPTAGSYTLGLINL
ncbi:predicted transcriptional regulator [Candidatus Vecturithrix granuli]|uniref:Predicted transcriptional regulator n=1 Tax=Vecturithrix granuli TaxID=1499967 RepID=A0A081BUJ5_VECG1|nr:predicted transcriptional regulator [Candidatus Vecturithrix granuli]